MCWSKDHDPKACRKLGLQQMFTYLGDMVSAGGGCKVAVTVKTRTRWVKFMECGELLYGKRFLQS